MSNQDWKTILELDKQLTSLCSIVNHTEAGQATHKIEEIKAFIQQALEAKDREKTDEINRIKNRIAEMAKYEEWVEMWDKNKDNNFYAIGQANAAFNILKFVFNVDPLMYLESLKQKEDENEQ